MPIIDTKSPNKFDKVIRTNKGENLLSLIFASYHVKEGNNDRKIEIARNLRVEMDLFKHSGAGVYGSEDTKVDKQFYSFYTMGSEMGIWADDSLNLSKLALKVAEQDITVKQYIGTVFLNLFTYFDDGKDGQKYHHFLHDLLKYLVENQLVNSKDISKELIGEIFPLDSEQVNLLFQYLIVTPFFKKASAGFALSPSWEYRVDELISNCNLKYKDSDPHETQEYFKARHHYSPYVTQELIEQNPQEKGMEDDVQVEAYDFKQGFINYMNENGVGHIQYVGQLSKAVERWNKENLSEIIEDIYVNPRPILDNEFFERWEKSLNELFEKNGGGFDVRKHISSMKKYRDYISTIDLDNLPSHNISQFPDALLVDTGINRIYFGAPGTGKSFGIKTFIQENGIPGYDDKIDHPNVFRTSLHPEFGYNDFVGQVMPVVKKRESEEEVTISYEFTPQVFTKALKRAFEDKVKDVEPIFLVLEEMSRSNVAAVFGDLFQLLDRDENGESEYRVDNSLISTYVFGKNSTKKIYLPKNFYVLGTVNTSDQNVYVMDTAFKRRFEFNYLETSELARDKNGEILNEYVFTLKNSFGKNVNISWIKLLQTLNNFISTDQEKGGLGLPEDKQLGQFFIKFKKPKENASGEQIEKIEEFNYNQIKGKLLQYLWTDVQEVAYTDNRLFSEDANSFGETYKKAKMHLNFFSHKFTEKLGIELYLTNSEADEEEKIE